MNENINLCEILKGHEGEEFYFYGQGECILTDAKSDRFPDLPIVVKVKHDISGSHNKGDLILLSEFKERLQDELGLEYCTLIKTIQGKMMKQLNL